MTRDGAAEDSFTAPIDGVVAFDASRDVELEADLAVDQASVDDLVDSSVNQAAEASDSAEVASTAMVDAFPQAEFDGAAEDEHLDQQDLIVESDTQDGSTDGSVEAPAGSWDGATDEPSDQSGTPEAMCGATCPSSVSFEHLRVWLAAD